MQSADCPAADAKALQELTGDVSWVCSSSSPSRGMALPLGSNTSRISGRTFSGTLQCGESVLELVLAVGDIPAGLGKRCFSIFWIKTGSLTVCERTFTMVSMKSSVASSWSSLRSFESAMAPRRSGAASGLLTMRRGHLWCQSSKAPERLSIPPDRSLSALSGPGSRQPFVDRIGLHFNPPHRPLPVEFQHSNASVGWHNLARAARIAAKLGEAGRCAWKANCARCGNTTIISTPAPRLPKLHTRVRFPSPAPGNRAAKQRKGRRGSCGCWLSAPEQRAAISAGACSEAGR